MTAADPVVTTVAVTAPMTGVPAVVTIVVVTTAVRVAMTGRVAAPGALTRASSGAARV